MNASSELVIGVDGGGTKTVAWLAPLDDVTGAVILGRGQAGPGNPRAAGFEVALPNIAAAVEAAFVDAEIPRRPAAAASLGLAGAGREVEQQRIAAWAKERQIANLVRVTGDAEAILAAASSNNCGVALICGTGSLACGRNLAGQTARAGGWGYLMGDEGSGYAIAKAALVAAVRAADGRGEKTVLLDQLQHELGAAVPADLVECIYASEMTREKLAALAKTVFESAEHDDVAQAIIAGAADDLAEMVVAVCRQLNLAENAYSLAFAGSVIANQPRMLELLVARLKGQRLAPAQTTVVEEPVRGAVVLARWLAKKRPPSGR